MNVDGRVKNTIIDCNTNTNTINNNNNNTNILATITSQIEITNLINILNEGKSIKFENCLDSNGNQVINIIVDNEMDKNTDNDNDNYDGYTEKGNIVII